MCVHSHGSSNQPRKASTQRQVRPHKACAPPLKKCLATCCVWQRRGRCSLLDDVEVAEPAEGRPDASDWGLNWISKWKPCQNTLPNFWHSAQCTVGMEEKKAMLIKHLLDGTDTAMGREGDEQKNYKSPKDARKTRPDILEQFEPIL